MDIATEMMVYESDTESPPVQAAFLQQKGYASPRVDVRSFIVKDNKVLMVQEKQDERWSLPGGWADVNHTPSECIVKEVHEETGYFAKVHKLMALWDTALHEHPPHWPYIYKCVFYCSIEGGHWVENNEILAVNYFDIDKLPELSEYRITKQQILQLWNMRENCATDTVFD